eukprot:3071344-Rhodomonas_salina.3
MEKMCSWLIEGSRRAFSRTAQSKVGKAKQMRREKYTLAELYSWHEDGKTPMNQATLELAIGKMWCVMDKGHNAEWEGCGAEKLKWLAPDIMAAMAMHPHGCGCRNDLYASTAGHALLLPERAQNKE